jgi:hypothetical protein
MTRVVQVVDAQPMLVLASTSLGRDNAIQCFEGENQSFEINLSNLGKVPLTFMNISIKETIQPQENDGSQIQNYETFVYQKSIAACWVDGFGHSEPFFRITDRMAVDQSRSVRFNLIGKKHNTEIRICIEYGTVSDTELIHTRKLEIPVLITVGLPLILRNIDFLAVDEHEILANSPSSKEVFMANDKTISATNDYFWLTFDLENIWNEAFHIEFKVNDGNLISWRFW